MRRTLFLAFLLTGILPMAVSGDDPGLGGTFTFQFRQEGDRYFFEGRFTVDTDPQGAWEVLTDYDHVSRFVANMSCRVVKREGDLVLVDQTVGGGFLFIRQEVKGLLKVKETPLHSICLEEVTGRSFGFYQAAWGIEPPAPQGVSVQVTYSLQAERNADTPGFVTPGLFRQAAEDLVIGMKKEMDRREAVKRMKALKAGTGKSGS